MAVVPTVTSRAMSGLRLAVVTRLATVTGVLTVRAEATVDLIGAIAVPRQPPPTGVGTACLSKVEVGVSLQAWPLGLSLFGLACLTVVVGRTCGPIPCLVTTV